MSYNLKTLVKIWKDGNNRGDKIAITSLGKYGNYAIPAPEGLIVPYNDTSIPDGWTRFTGADNRMIIGAGSSYNPGNTGGTTSVSITSQTLASAGAHTGTTWIYHTVMPGTFGFYAYSSNVELSAGAHSHSISTGTGTYQPLCNNIVLIKASQQHSSLPAKAIALSHSGQIGSLTNVLNNNRYLRGSSSIGTTGSNTVSFSCPYSSAGVHHHFSMDGVRGTYHPTYNPNGTYTDLGGHSGTANLSLSISEAIRKVQLSAWLNASEQIAVEPNMIGMYESLTPPSGWVLCNGSNGTPDLRNSFVYNVSGGSETSTGSGTNTVTISGSGSSSHNASHDHYRGESNPQLDIIVARHTLESWNHSHSYNISQAKSYLPPYYALAFIMKS